jgi:hypothetical protein
MERGYWIKLNRHKLIKVKENCRRIEGIKHNWITEVGGIEDERSEALLNSTPK